MSNRASKTKTAKLLQVGLQDVTGKFQSTPATAALAIYQSAQPNPMQVPATRVGTNPNSAFSSIERVRLSFEGENAFKNTPFARNYILKRRAYCSSGANWAPNTGDPKLNALVLEYCKEQWRDMGVNRSMLATVSLVGDCYLPERGDSAMRILRMKDGTFKLIPITADCIGEIFYFQQNTIAYKSIKLVSGEEVFPQFSKEFQYFAGLYFDGPMVAAYKIYERIGDTVYVNPQNYPAQDVIFYQDDLTGGVRGVSVFATALLSIAGRYQIMHSTMQTMQQQSKVAAISSNNSGGPAEYTYDTVTNSDGSITYQERYADGAVVKFNYVGDSYQVLRAEHPTEAFMAGIKCLDQDAALSVGFPSEFLFSPSDSNGAPSRFAFSIAGREIERLREDVHRPRLDKIAFLTILAGIQTKALPSNNPRITKGQWLFGTLPTADAFRDSKSDIAENRAGLTDRESIIIRNFGGGADHVFAKLKEEAILRHKMAQDANDELILQNYDPTISPDDIWQISDNPQQAAAASNIEQGKSVNGNQTQNAQLSGFDESQHPRGEPENAGEFGPGGGGGKKYKPRKPSKPTSNKTQHPELSEKAQRAKDNHVMVDKTIQRYAEEHNEPAVAKALGGVSFPDGEPIDIAIAGDSGKVEHGVELKTVVKNSNGKITMKGDAIARKRAWERKNKATIHTVVVDDTKVFNANGNGKHDDSQRKIYYRRGYGSFRIASMHEVKSFEEVKTLMNTPTRKLPAAAK